MTKFDNNMHKRLHFHQFVSWFLFTDSLSRLQQMYLLIIRQILIIYVEHTLYATHTHTLIITFLHSDILKIPDIKYRICCNVKLLMAKYVVM